MLPEGTNASTLGTTGDAALDPSHAVLLVIAIAIFAILW
jgi:hypothetical protein